MTGLAAAALAVAGVAACKRAPDREPAAAPATAPGSSGDAAVPPPLAGNAFYRIDAGPQTPCTAGAPCEARLVLSALGAYKVNRDYPFKFVAEPAPGLAVDGPGAMTFDDAKTGTLTIRFRAARGGPARLTGTFKLSVCTDEECQIEEPK
ncbi:MAG TPA: hypothetical protein VK932_19985, partial [Kofleriaceae bacterium]|nr:hypothetical protein [Kofleriaceae bacterium]